MKVLVVDDDPSVLRVLHRALSEDGYHVTTARDGFEAVWSATQQDYDVIVLDVMLPGLDGLQVCRRLREAEVWAPVLMLSARSQVTDLVTGLDGGADDYLAKPFRLGELSARLRALTRRVSAPRPAVLEAGNLRLDPATRRAARGGCPLELSATQSVLLELFLRQVGVVLSRTVISEHVGDWAVAAVSNVVDQAVSQLRRQIDRPFGVEQLITVRGAGYQLLPLPRAAGARASEVDGA